MNTEKQMTAIEWLYSALRDYKAWSDETGNGLRDIWIKAEEMEKQQTQQAYREGFTDGRLVRR